MINEQLNSEDRDALVSQLYLTSTTPPIGQSRPVWKRLLGELLGEPSLVAASLLVLLIGATTTTLSPRLLGYLIDEGIVRKSEEKAQFYVGWIVINEGVRILSVVMQGLIVGSLGLRVMHKLRTELLTRVLRLKVKVLDSIHAGQLVSRITEDTNALSQLFTSNMVMIAEKLLIVTGIFVSMITLNGTLTLTAAFLIPILLGAGLSMSRKIYALTSESRQKTGAVSGFLTETLGVTKLLRMLGAEQIVFRRFKIVSEQLRAAQFRPTLVNAYFHPGMTLVNATTIGLLMWIGSGMIAQGELSIGVLVTFISYTLWVFWPIIHIVNQWNVVVAGMASAQRMFSLYELETEGTAQEEYGGTNTRINDFEIRFEGVWFSYSDVTSSEDTHLLKEGWVLRDVSFTIPAGTRVGLVGATGSGKSTILALLFGFYTPQRGEIYFGGKPLSHWPLRELRNTIALLQQDGALFGGSVGENTSFFGECTGRACEMLDRVGLNDTTKDVATLSSGERQWVLLARALTRTPQVWILDEAASHLDPELDQELHRRVEEITEGATMIVVAHRLASVETLDTLIVLDRGRVAEMGTPETLQRQGGLYARMIALQKSHAAIPD